VLHSGGHHLHLRLASSDGYHRVEVEDHYPGMPTARAAAVGTTDAVGNGLHLLTALAAASGVTPTATGKIVWATFPAAGVDPTAHEASVEGPQFEQARTLPSPQEALRAEVGRFHAEVGRFHEEAGLEAETAGEDLMHVQLVGLPLVLFAAQLRHDRELLRELELVARADGPYPAAELVELARELTLYRGMGESTELERAAALERGAVTLDVLYRLPRFAGPACDRMARLLARADAYAREGALLVLPPTPEQVAVRDWFLCQITQQCEGADPQPWTGPL